MGYSDGCDIAIKDEFGNWLIGIKCRRWDDDEYEKEVRAIRSLIGHPVRIAGQNEQFQILCVYASTLRSGLIDCGYTIFPLTTGNRLIQGRGLESGVVSEYDWAIRG